VKGGGRQEGGGCWAKHKTTVATKGENKERERRYKQNSRRHPVFMQ